METCQVPLAARKRRPPSRTPWGPENRVGDSMAPAAPPCPASSRPLRRASESLAGTAKQVPLGALLQAMTRKGVLRHLFEEDFASAVRDVAEFFSHYWKETPQ